MGPSAAPALMIVSGAPNRPVALDAISAPERQGERRTSSAKAGARAAGGISDPSIWNHVANRLDGRICWSGAGTGSARPPVRNVLRVAEGSQLNGGPRAKTKRPSARRSAVRRGVALSEEGTR